MTKAELVTKISKNTGIQKQIVLAIVEEFMVTVKQNMVNGENINLRTFGTFTNKLRVERYQNQTNKKEKLFVPAHYKPTFKASKEFIRMINEDPK